MHWYRGSKSHPSTWGKFMNHFAYLFELEMRYINSMTRQQLLDNVLERSSDAPADLLDGMAQESNEYLQMLLLAAHFVRALRQTRRSRTLGAPQAN